MARVSAEQWRARVTAWEASGKTATTFAAARSFDARQLRWWKWKLGRDGRAQRRVVATRPAFVPAHVAVEVVGKTSAAFEVTFASGIAVRVPAGFNNPRALAELIEVVGAIRC